MPSSLSIYSQIHRLSIKDDYIEWRYCSNNINIRSHFSDKDWNYIVLDLNTDKELLQANKKGYLALYEVKAKGHAEPFGFAFVLVNDPQTRTVSVHGGAWDASARHLFLHAYMLINIYLLDSGYRVRSSCSKENVRALRFIKSCGFRIYRYEDERILLYLSRPLLENS